jgi:predicted amidohydrolase YtcJ
VSGERLFVNVRAWSGVPLGADAVLVRGGRIAAVGEAGALAAQAPRAERLDGDGATLTPGFVDAHLHLVPWARGRRQPDLRPARTRAAALETVRRALAALPPGAAPLVGRGWDDAGWEVPPGRAALDALAPERPVLLHRHDFHALWVNSAALRAAGVTRATPDPEGGRFERDAAGEPTGLVREHAVRAFAALEERAAPAPDDALLDAAARELHAEGITGVHDYQRGADDWHRMRALAGRRRLRVLQHVGPERAASARGEGLTGGAGDAWFRTGAVKLFADGTLGSRTAALLEPYDDVGGTGMALYTPAELAREVAAAAAAGFSVAVHAIGDAAVASALDAIAAHRDALARASLPPRLEHIQLLADADRPRLARLGVAASLQPRHLEADAPVARRAWGARCRRAYPWRSLLEAGVPLAFGSDAPVEPPSAAHGLACAVLRLTSDGLPFGPGEAIPLDAALVACTSAPARLAGHGLGRGVLVPGEPADLVIWDRDLHRAPPADLARARPRWTVLAGEIVYDSEREPPEPAAGRHAAVPPEAHA